MFVPVWLVGFHPDDLGRGLHHSKDDQVRGRQNQRQTETEIGSERSVKWGDLTWLNCP